MREAIILQCRKGHGVKNCTTRQCKTEFFLSLASAQIERKSLSTRPSLKKSGGFFLVVEKFNFLFLCFPVRHRELDYVHCTGVDKNRNLFILPYVILICSCKFTVKENIFRPKYFLSLPYSSIFKTIEKLIIFNRFFRFRLAPICRVVFLERTLGRRGTNGRVSGPN